MLQNPKTENNNRNTTRQGLQHSKETTLDQKSRTHSTEKNTKTFFIEHHVQTPVGNLTTSRLPEQLPQNNTHPSVSIVHRKNNPARSIVARLTSPSTNTSLQSPTMDFCQNKTKYHSLLRNHSRPESITRTGTPSSRHDQTYSHGHGRTTTSEKPRNKEKCDVSNDMRVKIYESEHQPFPSKYRQKSSTPALNSINTFSHHQKLVRKEKTYEQCSPRHHPYPHLLHSNFFKAQCSIILRKKLRETLMPKLISPYQSPYVKKTDTAPILELLPNRFLQIDLQAKRCQDLQNDHGTGYYNNKPSHTTHKNSAQMTTLQLCHRSHEAKVQKNLDRTVFA